MHPPTTVMSTLSLHDALPISYTSTVDVASEMLRVVPVSLLMRDSFHSDRRIAAVHVPLLIMHRSEEHTSELQSRLHIVCRLLLEKKKRTRKDDNSHTLLDSII